MVLGACLAGAIGASASAQTAAPLFRSWEWLEGPQSVRAAGLAGAVAAEPSDASTAVLFPAGLSLVSEPDLRVSVRYAGSGSGGAGQVSAQWAPGEVAFALPVGLRWGVGAYYRNGRQLDLEIGDAPLPGGSFGDGRLSVESREAGVAVGFAAWPSLRLGARLGLARLDLAGDVSSTAPSGAVSAVESSLKDDTPRFGAGVLFAPEQRVQIGLEYDSRVTWSATPPGPAAGPPDGRVSPSRLALGVLYRPSTAVQILAQVDRVGWSAVSLDDATDVRFGLELRPEYGNIGIWNRVALRVGLQLRSRGRLESVGDDPAQEARFPGAGHATEWSVGLACWRFEVSWIGRKPSNVWVFGVRQPF